MANKENNCNKDLCKYIDKDNDIDRNYTFDKAIKDMTMKENRIIPKDVADRIDKTLLELPEREDSVNNDDTNTVYIDVMKGIPVQSITNSNTESGLLYTEVTTVDLSLTNYKLNISNTEISNINVTTSDTDIKFSGNINGTSGEEGLSVVVKLFDEMANTLGENKYEYTLENPLNGEGTFEVSFILSDTLKLENIKKYSIDVVR